MNQSTYHQLVLGGELILLNKNHSYIQLFFFLYIKGLYINNPCIVIMETQVLTYKIHNEMKESLKDNNIHY